MYRGSSRVVSETAQDFEIQKHARILSNAHCTLHVSNKCMLLAMLMQLILFV